MKFKDGFVWGAATAAYQVEGAAHEGGRGPSVWDVFCKREGAVVSGHSGVVACDHYHRMEKDVAIMADLNLNAYRFSFSWPRILPDGIGALNPAGLEFYDRLIDKLLEYGIVPYPTLFHWDYPNALFQRGGWLNPDSVEWFGEYTAVVAEKYSDRVQNWWTLNEPPCFLGLGHLDGIHAPGLKLDWSDFLLACKHTLMSHGRAVQVLRAVAKTQPRIGFVPISHVGIPEDESRASVQAAREYTFGIPTPDRRYWFARMFIDPVVLGEWPEACIQAVSGQSIKVSDADLRLMSQPIDLLGLNFYSAPTIGAGKDGRPLVRPHPAGHPKTGFDWPVTPEAMYWSVRFHHERYGLPIMIAENGMSSLDWVVEDGSIPDHQRIDFLTKYLRSLHRAHAEGFPIDGYFHWTFMDNFEWAEGYRHRFGLVHVDFETQVRTVKDSGWWYAKVIKDNGVTASPEMAKTAAVFAPDIRESTVAPQ